MKRLVKQIGRVDRPTQEYMHQIMGWLEDAEHSGSLLIYGHVGKVSIEVLLDIFEYTRVRYGCDQFIIDSLMRLGIDGDDYTGQERVTFKLVDWMISGNVHLHLVAHSRKRSAESGVPESEDVKRGMEIGANAFNIVTISRDKKHERKL
jgi:twinkle protein